LNDEDLATIELDSAETTERSVAHAAMTIRVWREEDQEMGFRARLIFTAGDDMESSLVFAEEPERVIDAVRQWLSETAS
jgi:precorrin isomerase